ncbi:MAG TPA: ribosome maturation factor RimM [Steroidobacteraceae bacterium]|nr:ribosome maturation factor RimM [Steroidobacteraceae bacterium]
MSAGDDSPPLIELGSVGAPYGVRGWIKVRSYTEPPERVFEKRRLQLVLRGRSETYQIESTGRSGGQLTAKLRGVDDRDQARSLTGASIVVARDELPPRAAGDFYQTDLIGCEVVNRSGVRLGVVRCFIETPAHTIMVVQGQQEIWVPAVPQHLQRVDLKARRVVVNWDEPAG